MTKQEAINAMLNGSKVTHRFFEEWEYIYMESGEIFYECGISISLEDFWKHRPNPEWQINWTIYRGDSE